MIALRAALVIAALSLSGCATATRDITPAFRGTWGGEHIALAVGTMDTAVEFDCTEGMIRAPYLVNGDGSFEWHGTYTRGTGGPVRSGDEPVPADAVYFGVLRGPEMTMSVRLGDGQVIGPFALERFKEPQIFRCL